MKNSYLAFLLFLSVSICWAQSTPPGATEWVKVTVPQNMRSSPFNTERFVSLPRNFSLAVYARISGARFMAIAPNGDLLVSVPGQGRVKLVRPSASGSPQITDFVSGLARPHDLVFHEINGTTYLYVSEKNKISRYTYQNGDLTGQNREIIVDNLPDASLPELNGNYGHELKNIALDRNHNLYVSIASTCNACASDTQSDPIRGAIYVYDAQGKNRRLFAKGLRNAEGLAFIPGTDELWVTVNNRDQIRYPFNDATGNYGKIIPNYVDNNPAEEFTKVRDGGDYGWPFCNPVLTQGTENMPFAPDYELNRNGTVNCDNMNRISKGIAAHSAPLGFVFSQGTKLAAPYNNGAILALHGSWNRTKKTGYKVIYFPWNASTQTPGAQVSLVDHILNEDSTSAWARPVDVAIDLQGNLLISDDQSGTIFKMSYHDPLGVNDNLPTGYQVNIAPMPAQKSTQLTIEVPAPINATVTLVNLHGDKLWETTQTLARGSTKIKVATDHLPAGMYLLQIGTPAFQVSRKVLVQKE
ncbi:T9SS type A sorting domain-containing protein [Rufibacter latericius]|uniref:T9SS C-terminal target domain-containing protein n=1 Tax=Rufibacter latericius TaxID=2487040 RepID=A0A3M9MTA5_9BACT|nr:T9SS type A sorting domain-containing protein [Rufibacter latericius]RNI28764.1 T9SS C-terminal target domain-containing protein [Rufibacter latericius]